MPRTASTAPYATCTPLSSSIRRDPPRRRRGTRRRHAGPRTPSPPVALGDQPCRARGRPPGRTAAVMKSILWSTSSIETPSSCRARRCPASCSVSAALSPADGSSSSRMPGSAWMARASSSSRRWPYDRRDVGSSASVAQPDPDERALGRVPAGALVRVDRGPREARRRQPGAGAVGRSTGARSRGTRGARRSGAPGRCARPRAVAPRPGAPSPTRRPRDLHRAGRRHHPGDRVEERGLPAAVGADEPEDLVLAHGQAHPVDGPHPAERHPDPLGDEDRGPVAAIPLGFWRRKGRTIGPLRRQNRWDDRLGRGLARGDAEQVAQPGAVRGTDAVEADRLQQPADTDQPDGERDHRDHEERAEEDVAEVAEAVLLPEGVDRELDPGDAEHTALQPLRHEDVEGGADDRPPAGVDAAEDQHHEDAEPQVDAELVGRRRSSWRARRSPPPPRRSPSRARTSRCGRAAWGHRACSRRRPGRVRRWLRAAAVSGRRRSSAAARLRERRARARTRGTACRR